MKGFGCRVSGVGFRVQGSRCRVSLVQAVVCETRLGFEVQGLGMRVQGVGFRV